MRTRTGVGAYKVSPLLRRVFRQYLFFFMLQEVTLKSKVLVCTLCIFMHHVTYKTNEQVLQKVSRRCIASLLWGKGLVTPSKRALVRFTTAMNQGQVIPLVSVFTNLDSCKHITAIGPEMRCVETYCFFKCHVWFPPDTSGGQVSTNSYEFSFIYIVCMGFILRKWTSNMFAIFSCI